jgi:parvulin-like peptidyl-prolyl isomerase
MKYTLKIIIALAIIILISITGWHLFRLYEERDRQQVIAEVNDEIIVKGQMLYLYEQQKKHFGITDGMEKEQEIKDMIYKLKLDILDGLIYERLAAQNAREAGYIVTDELLEEAEAQLEYILTGIAEDIQQADEESYDRSRNVDYMEEARKHLESELKYMGIKEEQYLNMMAEQLLVKEFLDDLKDGIQVTEDDIKEYYDSQLEMQKQNPRQKSYDVQLFAPAKARLKYILLELPEEYLLKYDELLMEDKDRAQDYLNESLKILEPQAQSILDQARAGKDFDELIKKYNPDAWLEEYENGYVMSQNGEFDSAFEDAVFELEEGEISNLVASSLGYYIIKVYETTNQQIFSLEEKTQEIEQALLTIRENELMKSMEEKWYEKAVINKHENRI